MSSGESSPSSVLGKKGCSSAILRRSASSVVLALKSPQSRIWAPLPWYFSISFCKRSYRHVGVGVIFLDSRFLRHVTFANTEKHFRATKHDVFQLQPKVAGIISCCHKLNTISHTISCAVLLNEHEPLAHVSPIFPVSLLLQHKDTSLLHNAPITHQSSEMPPSFSYQP